MQVSTVVVQEELSTIMLTRLCHFSLASSKFAWYKALMIWLQNNFQDLSLYVNEVKRDDEALQLINEIQHSIVDLAMVRNVSF